MFETTKLKVSFIFIIGALLYVVYLILVFVEHSVIEKKLKGNSGNKKEFFGGKREYWLENKATCNLFGVVIFECQSFPGGTHPYIHTVRQ